MVGAYTAPEGPVPAAESARLHEEIRALFVKSEAARLEAEARAKKLADQVESLTRQLNAVRAAAADARMDARSAVFHLDMMQGLL